MRHTCTHLYVTRGAYPYAVRIVSTILPGHVLTMFRVWDGSYQLVTRVRVPLLNMYVHDRYESPFIVRNVITGAM